MLEARGTGVVTQSFAYQHLKAALLFRSQLMRVEAENAGAEFGDFLEDIRSYGSGAFLGAMYGEDARAKELGLQGDALRAHRQTYIRPLAEDFLSWMNAIEPSLLPSDPLAQAIRYSKNHRGALLRFVDAPDRVTKA